MNCSFAMPSIINVRKFKFSPIKKVSNTCFSYYKYLCIATYDFHIQYQHFLHIKIFLLILSFMLSLLKITCWVNNLYTCQDIY